MAAAAAAALGPCVGTFGRAVAGADDGAAVLRAVQAASPAPDPLLAVLEQLAATHGGAAEAPLLAALLLEALRGLAVRLALPVAAVSRGVGTARRRCAAALVALARDERVAVDTEEPAAATQMGAVGLPYLPLRIRGARFVLVREGPADADDWPSAHARLRAFVDDEHGGALQLVVARTAFGRRYRRLAESLGLAVVCGVDEAAFGDLDVAWGAAGTLFECSRADVHTSPLVVTAPDAGTFSIAAAPREAPEGAATTTQVVPGGAACEVALALCLEREATGPDGVVWEAIAGALWEYVRIVASNEGVEVAAALRAVRAAHAAGDPWSGVRAAAGPPVGLAPEAARFESIFDVVQQLLRAVQ